MIQFPKSEPRRTIEISTWEGLFANAYIVITDVPYLTAFAVMLAANNTLIALIGGLPYLTRVFQVLGAFLVERYGKRKTISIASGALTAKFGLSLSLWHCCFQIKTGYCSVSLAVLRLFRLWRAWSWR